jgi:peptidoglycan/xylan/chitin deacetylase (PgdA/CDA1 family)
MSAGLPAPLWRLAARLRSGGGSRGRLLILTYHRVLPEADPLLEDDVDVTELRWQMELVARLYRVLPLPEAVEALYAGRLPAGSVCVTFDDGYANNCQLALPVMKRLGLPATFFIATSFLDGGRMWNDTVIEALRRTRASTLDLNAVGAGSVSTDSIAARKQAIAQVIGAFKYLPPEERQQRCEKLAELCGSALPDDLMMTSAMVAQLANAGMDVGGHTHTHPILSSVDAAQAEQEIRSGRERLQAIIGSRVVSFAYPNGRPNTDYTRRDASLVEKAGFSLAVTTAMGTNDTHSPRFELSRLAPWDRTPTRFLLRLLQAYGWRGAVAAEA